MNLDCEEYRKVWSITSLPTVLGIKVELSADEIVNYDSAMFQFNRWQRRLAAMYEQHRSAKTASGPGATAD